MCLNHWWVSALDTPTMWVVRVFGMWTSHRALSMWSLILGSQHGASWQASTHVPRSWGQDTISYCRTSDGKFHETPIQRIVRQWQMTDKLTLATKSKFEQEIHPSLCPSLWKRGKYFYTHKRKLLVNDQLGCSFLSWVYINGHSILNAN